MKGLSTYLDKLLEYSMSDAFKQILPMNAAGLGTHVDFFAFGVTMLCEPKTFFYWREID